MTLEIGDHMDSPQFDTDLFEFFSHLIDDEEEVEILRKILEGKVNEIIIREYLQNLGNKTDDQN